MAARSARCSVRADATTSTGNRVPAVRTRCSARSRPSAPASTSSSDTITGRSAAIARIIRSLVARRRSVEPGPTSTANCSGDGNDRRCSTLTSHRPRSAGSTSAMRRCRVHIRRTAPSALSSSKNLADRIVAAPSSWDRSHSHRARRDLPTPVGPVSSTSEGCPESVTFCSSLHSRSRSSMRPTSGGWRTSYSASPAPSSENDARGRSGRRQSPIEPVRRTLPVEVSVARLGPTGSATMPVCSGIAADTPGSEPRPTGLVTGLVTVPSSDISMPTVGRRSNSAARGPTPPTAPSSSSPCAASAQRWNRSTGFLATHRRSHSTNPSGTRTPTGSGSCSSSCARTRATPEYCENGILPVSSCHVTFPSE